MEMSAGKVSAAKPDATRRLHGVNGKEKTPRRKEPIDAKFQAVLQSLRIGPVASTFYPDDRIRIMMQTQLL